MRWAACALVALAASTEAFYVPGASPVAFEANQKVDIRANKIVSSRTQMPFSYYSLPVCQPANLDEGSVSLGEILTGDRSEASPYELVFKKDTTCNVLCRKVYTEEDAKVMREHIENEYQANWVVDNMPSALRMVDPENEEEIRFQRGIPIGETSQEEPKAHFLFNHLHFKLGVHREESDLSLRGLGPDGGGAEGSQGRGTSHRIVSFEVLPYSIKHRYTGTWDDSNPPALETCSPFKQVTRDSPALTVDGPGEVIFTYDVEWEDSDTPWSHRWDLYLKGVGGEGMHWYSILNSIIIILFLTGMIATILVRSLMRDIVAINSDEEEDETGWKLIHGDVFRPPSGLVGPMVLAVLVGSGVQIACMVAAVLVFAVLGVLSPANRGALATALVVLFVLMGAFAGFVSSRIYKMFLGKLWARNAVLTATVFPGTVASIAFILNMVLWSRGSTLALPFGTMVAIAAMWFFISTPLVMVGAYVGFTRDAIKPPVHVTVFANTIPPQPLYLHPVVTALIGGVLPFAAVFIELYFIMSSIWLAQPYYLFGFLALAVIILAITCAEISIVMCYFQLSARNHRWWWRSFLNSGASALYVFLYSIIYFAFKLDITDAASATLYFGNMLMVTFAFFLLTGSMGFLSTLAFVRTIYASIKVA